MGCLGQLSGMGRRYIPVQWAASLVLGALLSTAVMDADAKPAIVVSTIRPINSLVAAVMDGVGTPTTLVPSDELPESFLLHDQDEKALRQVDLIFWIGPALEASLVHPFADPEVGARIIELGETEGLLAFPPRRGAEWEQPPGSRNPPGEGSEPAGADGHFWLDADNAKLMVGRIASALTDVDFAHAEAYRMNAAELRKRIDALDKELSQTLASLRDRPFLVLHDDFQYFEARYGLQGVGSIRIDAGAISQDRLKEVAAKVARLHATCVIGDTPGDDDLLRAIADAAGVKTARIDIYGGNLKEGADLYFKAMKEIAAGFASCLAGS
jgi:zinc transport system substrate-binding protein